MQLLDIERYRKELLAGIVLSTTTKTDSTVRICLSDLRVCLLTLFQQRPVATALVTYAVQLPISTDIPDRYDQRRLAGDLLVQAQKNVGSNNVVIPVLQTFNVLLEADVFENLPQDQQGIQTWVISNHTDGFFSLAYIQFALSIGFGLKECCAAQESTANQCIHEMVCLSQDTIPHLIRANEYQPCQFIANCRTAARVHRSTIPISGSSIPSSTSQLT